MTSKLLLQKALHALDAGQVADGERLLGEALHVGEAEGDRYTPGRALCALGDLMHELGRQAEARGFLERFLLMPYDDDVLELERNRAKDLLSRQRN